MTALLEIQNLSVSFSDKPPVVRNASLTIGKGETVALVGESGSGKSVTALSVLKLLPPNASHPTGRILYNGQNLLAASESALRSLRGGKIAMIFQEPMTSLNPLQTVGKQIAETLTVHKGLSYEESEQRIVDLLQTVGLRNAAERLNAYPYELSGGERQRVMIAMALANEPDLLIADEPTTALDVTIQAQIITLLKNLKRRFNMAILFISHDLDVVSGLADKTLVMQNGEIVEQGETKLLLRAPQHPYTKKLIAARAVTSPVPVDSDAKVLLAAERIGVAFPIKKNFFGRPTAFINAVDDVSLTVKEGQCVGLVGESGSGKSTLGVSLLNLQKHTGNVVFNGIDLKTLPAKQMRPLRKEMQIVFQDPYASLNPRMRIDAVLNEGLDIHFPDLSDEEKNRLVFQTLQDVGLPVDVLERYPHEFSGGQRQRIAIARAVVLKPKLMILDEPTSALDVSVQAQILTLLKNLQKQYKIAYLFISHDIRVVQSMADVVYVMKNGKIVETGKNPSIFKEAKEIYTQTLLKAAFDFTTGK